MESTEQDQKHTSYFTFGWWLIAIGVFFFAIFITDYKVHYVFNYTGLDNLAGIISSTTGICFSLAGLLFVLDNLALQREAIKVQKDELNQSNVHFGTQNEVIINQQYQSTFFNILNSHSAFITTLKFGDSWGYDGLRDYYQKMLHCIEVFKRFLDLNYFETYQTRSNPVYLFNSSRASWDAYFGNFQTVISFVETKLKDDLYYELFFNRLSNEEKFFIGLYCDCHDDKYTKILKNCSYDFLRYYTEQNVKYSLKFENYFPLVQIEKVGPPLMRVSKEVLQASVECFLISVDIQENLLTIEPIISKIHLRVTQGARNNSRLLLEETKSFSEIITKDMKPIYWFDCSAMLINSLLNALPNQPINVTIVIHFQYKEKNISVGYKHQPSVEQFNPGDYAYTV